MEGKNIRIVWLDSNRIIQDIREVPYSITKDGYLSKTVCMAIKTSLEIAGTNDLIQLHLVD